MIFGRRSWTRDHAPGKDDARIDAAFLARVSEQGILAGSARAHHQDEPAGSDALVRERRPLPGGRWAHATLRAPRQTQRTAAISSTTRTQMRSARLPGATSPRSQRPMASAGVLVTVRTAAARSIGATCGSRSAAISRLDGT